MLALSILIISALAVAVVSFFGAGLQWLLLVSAALVLWAFYLGRPVKRAPESEAEFGLDQQPRPLSLRPLSVLDDEILADHDRHQTRS